MRHLFRSLCVLALVALPLRVGAQGGEDAAQGSAASAQEPVRGVQRWHPDAYVDPAGPEAPQFKLEYAPLDPHEAAEKRVRKARVGVGVSAVGVGVGAAVAMGGAVAAIDCSFDSSCTSNNGVGAFAVGAVIGAVGVAGMIASGVMLHRRKQEWGSFRATQDATSRNVRWDRTTSRFVF